MTARWLATASGLPAVVALALGSALAVTTGLPWRVAAMHGLIGAACGLAGATVGLALGALASSPPRSRASTARYFTVGLPLFLLLLFAGVGAWVARRSWGMDLSGTILAGFLPHAPELVLLLGWRVATLLTAWVITSALCCAGWARTLARQEAGMPAASPRRALAFLAVATAGSLVTAVGGPEVPAPVVATFSGDPLLGLFSTGEQPALPPTAARFAAWADDEEQRRLLQPSSPGRRNIVLILSDGIRPDHLSFHGYPRDTTPFLSDLASQPAWVETPRAYSAATESLGGIGSIVSGRSTRTMGARSFGLVEFLARHGYRTHLLLNGAHGWYELRAMYGSRLTTFRDLRSATPGIPLHDDEQVAAWAGELPPSDGQPAFVMMFLMGTHQLSPVAPEDAHFSLEDGSPGPFWFAPQGPAQIKAAIDRYDDQLRATDRRLAKTWAILKSKGYLDDALVVYSSDHGQMLGEHGAYGHGAHLWEEAIRIPMALWTSDGRLPPLNTARTAWTPDLAPTIAEAAGLAPLPTWEGLSLFSDTPRRALWVDSVQAANHVRAVILEEDGSRWKLQQQLGPDGTPALERVFELTSDPAEARDCLSDAPTATLAELRRLATGS